MKSSCYRRKLEKASGELNVARVGDSPVKKSGTRSKGGRYGERARFEAKYQAIKKPLMK